MFSLLAILSGISLGLAIWRLTKFYQMHSPGKYDGEYEGDGRYIAWTVISGMVFALCFTITIIMTCMLAVEPAQIDQKIQMYQEENQKIEASVNAAVESYMKHEEKVFDKLDGSDSVTTLLIRFPELTSDNLVQKQIGIYQANNEKIKSLKNDKINLSTKRFLVYFGH